MATAVIRPPQRSPVAVERLPARCRRKRLLWWSVNHRGRSTTRRSSSRCRSCRVPMLSTYCSTLDPRRRRRSLRPEADHPARRAGEVVTDPKAQAAGHKKVDKPAKQKDGKKAAQKGERYPNPHPFFLPGGRHFLWAPFAQFRLHPRRG